jgi:hypothetical protein
VGKEDFVAWMTQNPLFDINTIEGGEDHDSLSTRFRTITVRNVCITDFCRHRRRGDPKRSDRQNHESAAWQPVCCL